MATYTQLNQADIDQLTANYGLNVDSFKPLVGGNGNSSFILKADQATYVLTVCDDKTFDEVVITAQLLLLLEANSIPGNRLIKPLNGDILSRYQDKAVMLKRFVEGQVIECLDEAMLSQLGRHGAKLNQVPAPDYLPTHHPYGRQRFENLLGLNIDLVFEAWLKQEIDYLEQNLSDKLPRGLIHGDLFNDNMLFEGDQFAAIIDFEEACHYYLGFELGMAVVGCCTDDVTVYLNKVRALVHGYQQVRPLEAIERQSLQLFVRYAAVATAFWRFNKYHLVEPDKDKANHHWQMAKIAQGVADIPPALFNDAVFG